MTSSHGITELQLRVSMYSTPGAGSFCSSLMVKPPCKVLTQNETVVKT